MKEPSLFLHGVLRGRRVLSSDVFTAREVSVKGRGTIIYDGDDGSVGVPAFDGVHLLPLARQIRPQLMGGYAQPHSNRMETDQMAGD